MRGRHGLLGYYDQLLRIKSSPVVALNRAVAVCYLHGPQAALDTLTAMGDRARLESHHLLHAVTGELQLKLGDHRAAAESFRRALKLAQLAPEQSHLSRMLARSEAGV